MRTVRLLAVAAAAAALLTACGDELPDEADPSPTAADTTTEPAAPAPGPTATAPSPAATTPASPTPTGTAAGTTVQVEVAGGEVVGGVQRVPVQLGETVTLEVTSDVADEVHLHGYDIHEDVAAGGTATITFEADIPGVFEAELEERQQQLVEFEVRG